MKLIFKIYKKYRWLRKEERRLIRDLNLGRELYWHERHCESKNAKNYFAEMEHEMHIRKECLDQREKELNSLQDKLNDQILKLGIVNGVNK